MKPKEIRTVYGYGYWAFEKVWESVMQLNDERLIFRLDRANDYGTSIFQCPGSCVLGWIRANGEARERIQVRFAFV